MILPLLFTLLLPCYGLEVVGEATLSKGTWYFRPTNPKVVPGKNFRLLDFPKPRFEGKFLYARLQAKKVPCPGKLPCLQVESYKPEFYDPLQQMPSVKGFR